ncbi:NUDIX hydrolase (plasmid) [Pontibacillus sp. ALD_SL1]|uniref:NUDIX hydrolase n=1 Tax=Pontibacillus sp. ALD_SL1 TaxID=2777185 RepID=UPI001A960E5F|nr:NUDIX hydrolase [Pontibacillus sp. ALD_SL1]QST02641.1 NUDIX hydrolase [Pontibacillus sp. ALD_SL1]
MKCHQTEQETLAHYNSGDYVTPDGYTSDIALFTILSDKKERYKPPEHTLMLMLIRRAEVDAEGNANVEGGKWALPGGFVRPDENALQAAVRELSEETGIQEGSLKHFDTYDEPGRDKRGWVLSNAHYAIVPETSLKERKASDDADDVRLFTVKEALKLDLAFDHHTIIKDALWYIKKDLMLTTRAKVFLPEEFVLSELQGVLKAVTDNAFVHLDSNFFRKMPNLPFIEPILEDGEPKKSNRHSKVPARLYRFTDYEPFVSIYSANY